MAVSWRFDGDDLLSGVSDGWDDFARANDGSACIPAPLGQSLADFISSPDLCVLWKAIFTHTRRSADRPVTLRYRCDAPSERRILRATLTTDATHELQIVSVVDQVQPRPELPLLTPRPTIAAPDMIRMCAWCARIHVDNWVTVEEGCRRLDLLEKDPTILPPITHGICDDCRSAIARGLDLPATLQSAGPRA